MMNPTTSFVRGPFQPQLTYYRDDINHFKPFLFPLLEKRVSVQASFHMASEFALADGRVLSYPFMLEISEMDEMFSPYGGRTERNMSERRTLPIERATRFEVALIDEPTDGWYTPSQLGIDMNTDDSKMWTCEDIGRYMGRYVSRQGVQQILDQLHEIELHLQHKLDDEENMKDRRETLASTTKYPAGIVQMIDGYLGQNDIDSKLMSLPVYSKFYS